jgi:hypothetical protein
MENNREIWRSIIEKAINEHDRGFANWGYIYILTSCGIQQQPTLDEYLDLFGEIMLKYIKDQNLSNISDDELERLWFG